MKIPKIINKGKKRYSFIQKCNDNLFLYQDQFGIKITFTKFDLKGIDNTEIDKLIKKPYAKIPKGFLAQKNKIVVYDTKKNKRKIYKSTKDVADDLEYSQTYINVIIQRKALLNKRYTIERVSEENIQGEEGKWEYIKKEKIC